MEKPLNRNTALHISSKEWDEITGRNDRKKLEAEAIAKEQAKKKYMKESSQAMIDSWENSLLNINRKKEEERANRVKQKRQDKIDRFYQLSKEQAEIREKYVEEVRETLYKQVGYPRDLNAAYLCSEVLYEREKQREFEEVLKKRKEEEERKYAEQVRKAVEEAKREEEEERRREVEKKKGLREFYYKQMKEAEDRAEEERRQKFVVEAIDNVKAAEDMRRISEMEQQQAEEYKKANRELALRNLQQCKEIKEMQKQEAKNTDILIAAQEEGRCRLAHLTRKKKEEIEQQKIARRMAVGAKVAAAAQEFEEQERRILENALAEREKREEEIVMARIEKAKKMKEERIRDRRLAIEREEERKREEAEVKRWETVNKYKTAEYRKEYVQRKKEEEWKKVLEYRERLQRQMEEREENEKKEKQEDVEFYRRKFCTTEEDDKFYKYAESLLHTAKSKGRPTYPIEKVIEKYRKENSLQAPSLCAKGRVFSTRPGKMPHDARNDPNFNKCRENVEALYRDDIHSIK